MTYEELKPRLAESEFRTRFHLNSKDRALIAAKGWGVIAAQAKAIITQRLASAHPENDGRQTPMRGFPVFVAQHATGCCCRGCLEKWHHIPQGRALTETEINSIVAVIISFLQADAGDLTVFELQPELF